jgi:hypothetical protein
MSYSHSSHKRTVRCSYCGHTGHNRASCSDLKERIEEIRDEHGDEHYTVRCYDRKKEKRKVSGKSRKCSYCDDGGHNRATCPQLKTNMVETKVKNAEFRKTVYEHLCRLGIGVGAIVSSDAHSDRVDKDNFESDRYRVPQVVTDINWLGINVWNREVWYFDSHSSGHEGENPAPLFTVPMGMLASANWKNTMGYPFDEELLKLFLNETMVDELKDGSHWRANEKGNHFLTVESPVPPSAPPAGWLEASDKKIKEIYKGRKLWQGAL